MNQSYRINFTYKSPFEDIMRTGGFNPDGSMNVRYSLLMLRNLLNKNIDILDKLLLNTDHISEIVPIDQQLIEIKFSLDSVKKELADNHVISVISVTNLNHDDLDNDDEEQTISSEPSDIENESELFDGTESETNYHRLTMINNLTNQNHHMDIFPNSDSHSESDIDSDLGSDDLINDFENRKLILNKYQNLFCSAMYDSNSMSNSEESNESSD